GSELALSNPHSGCRNCEQNCCMIPVALVDLFVRSDFDKSVPQPIIAKLPPVAIPAEGPTLPRWPGSTTASASARPILASLAATPLVAIGRGLLLSGCEFDPSNS